MYFDRVENAQIVLRRFAGYTGPIDGDPGVKSLSAAARVPGAPDDGVGGVWVPERSVIAAAQRCLAEIGFDVGQIDGFWGPQTDAAFDLWRGAASGQAVPDRTRPNNWGSAPREDHSNNWGREADMIRRFGQPGAPICTAGQISVPWDMVLAWDSSARVRNISCHADVAASAQRVFDRVSAIYSPPEIKALGLDQFGGCFNHRLKRGGTTYSTHSWGVALDFDPARNRLRWGAPSARLSHPDAMYFWRQWDAEGWLSLGRARGFDWMHVQAPA